MSPSLALLLVTVAAGGELALVSPSEVATPAEAVLPHDGSFEPPPLPYGLLQHSYAPLGPPSWWEQPLAADLHPVRVDFVRRWLVTLDDRLAGTRASPVFRDDVSRAQAHWAIVAWGGESNVLQESHEQGLMNAMSLASGMAAEDLVERTLRQSEVLDATHRTIRTVVSPSLELTPRRESRPVTVKHASVYDRNPRLSAATLEDRPVQRPPPQPRFVTGTSFRIRELDDDPELPLMDASVFASGENMVVDSWRISALVLNQQWVATARQRLWRGVDLTFQTRSASRSVRLDSWYVAAVTDLPDSFAEGWQVRASYTFRVASEDRLEPADRIGLELRARWGWRAPQEPGGYGLGDRWDRPGPYVPGSFDPESMEMVRVVNPPAGL